MFIFLSLDSIQERGIGFCYSLREDLMLKPKLKIQPKLKLKSKLKLVNHAKLVFLRWRWPLRSRPRAQD